MPFTCERCGRGPSWPEVLPVVGDMLRCVHCSAERAFVKPPFLVVTGAAGVGKSTLCSGLAGTIPDAILLDADVFASDLVSVVPPNQDYRGFWRSMLRFAHEIAQNDVAVVYFSTMLPAQVLTNDDLLDYFDGARFLCLACPPEVLHERLAGREAADPASVRVWVEFNDALVAAAGETRTATVIDASRPVEVVAHDVRRWISTNVADRG